jgi:hypothetical protein
MIPKALVGVLGVFPKKRTATGRFRTVPFQSIVKSNERRSDR